MPRSCVWTELKKAAHPAEMELSKALSFSARRCAAMREGTTIPLRRPALREALSEPVRAGAQRVIRQAVEAEPVAFPEEHAGAHDASGGAPPGKDKDEKNGFRLQGRNDERKSISSWDPE